MVGLVQFCHPNIVKGGSDEKKNVDPNYCNYLGRGRTCPSIDILFCDAKPSL